MLKLEAVIGFNIPPDDRRVDVGAVLDDDFTTPEVIDELLQAGALQVVDVPEPVQEPRTPRPSNGKTPKNPQRATAALSGEE